MIHRKISRTRVEIAGRECAVYSTEHPRFLLIQPVDDHDLEGMEEELEAICSQTDSGFVLAALRIADWNSELSPWTAPPVFGNQEFGNGAEGTLHFIEKELIPGIHLRFFSDREPILLLGGYSLAGFFSLWSATKTSLFSGINASSPSVWFPGWPLYRKEHKMLSEAVYLSLGDREEKTKNRTMALVGERIREEEIRLRGENRIVTLEWNRGNHFQDAPIRTARGFAWLMEHSFCRIKDTNHGQSV